MISLKESKNHRKALKNLKISETNENLRKCFESSIFFKKKYDGAVGSRVLRLKTEVDV